MVLDRIPLVVVGRIDQRVAGQFQQPAEDRVVLRARVAILEVGPAGPTDQQRVAGKHPVLEPKP